MLQAVELFTPCHKGHLLAVAALTRVTDEHLLVTATHNVPNKLPFAQLVQILLLLSTARAPAVSLQEMHVLFVFVFMYNVLGSKWGPTDRVLFLQTQPMNIILLKEKSG